MAGCCCGAVCWYSSNCGAGCCAGALGDPSPLTGADVGAGVGECAVAAVELGWARAPTAACCGRLAIALTGRLATEFTARLACPRPPTRPGQAATTTTTARQIRAAATMPSRRGRSPTARRRFRQLSTAATEVRDSQFLPTSRLRHSPTHEHFHHKGSHARCARAPPVPGFTSSSGEFIFLFRHPVLSRRPCVPAPLIARRGAS